MSVSPSGEAIVYLPEQANTGGECTIHFRKVVCVRPVYIRGRQLVALSGHTKLYTRDPLATMYPYSLVNTFKQLTTEQLLKMTEKNYTEALG